MPKLFRSGNFIKFRHAAKLQQGLRTRINPFIAHETLKRTEDARVFSCRVNCPHLQTPQHGRE